MVDNQRIPKKRLTTRARRSTLSRWSRRDTYRRRTRCSRANPVRIILHFRRRATTEASTDTNSNSSSISSIREVARSRSKEEDTDIRFRRTRFDRKALPPTIANSPTPLPTSIRSNPTTPTCSRRRFRSPTDPTRMESNGRSLRTTSLRIRTRAPQEHRRWRKDSATLRLPVSTTRPVENRRNGNTSLLIPSIKRRSSNSILPSTARFRRRIPRSTRTSFSNRNATTSHLVKVRRRTGDTRRTIRRIAEESASWEDR